MEPSTNVEDYFTEEEAAIFINYIGTFTVGDCKFEEFEPVDFKRPFFFDSEEMYHLGWRANNIEVIASEYEKGLTIQIVKGGNRLFFSTEYDHPGIEIDIGEYTYYYSCSHGSTPCPLEVGLPPKELVPRLLAHCCKVVQDWTRDRSDTTWYEAHV